MVAKVEEAVRARDDEDMLLIARTGGVRNESLDAAIERGRAYADAGADLVMLTPGSEDDLRRAAAEIPRPLALMSIAGRWDAGLLDELGVPIVIDPFTGQVEMYRALRNAYTHVRDEGAPATPSDELMAAYREMQGVAGMDELYAIEERTTEPPR
jgi:2-methylisocitrate lyase-like PEP mutase family enzyme